MKLAYPFLTEETEKKLLGFKGNMEEVFPTLKDLGYIGIEPLVRNPRKINTSLFTKLVDKYNLEIAAIGTGPIVSDDQLTFTSNSANKRKAAVDRAKEVVEFASLFDCPINIGKLRGDIHKDQPEQSWLWLREGIEQICEHADKYKIKVALEPQNRKVINNLNTTQEALTFIQKINMSNLKLMLDIYHMYIEDLSIEESLIAAKDYFIYIHIADHNRKTPGKGTLDFNKIFQILKELNYEGFITPEILQELSSYEEAKSAFNYLSIINLEKNIS
ncbi:sugar phosphate isomerase/epimerase family protein [Priestia megaterium]